MKKILVMGMVCVLSIGIIGCKNANKVAQTPPIAQENTQSNTEECVTKTAAVTLQGQKDSMTSLVASLKKPHKTINSEGEGKTTEDTAIIIASGNNTTFKLYNVTGWDDNLKDYKYGKLLHSSTMNQGESLVVNYNQTESAPHQVCQIIAGDGATTAIFNFSYDGKGDNTENGITKNVIRYGESTEEAEKNNMLIIRTILDIAQGEKDDAS